MFKKVDFQLPLGQTTEIKSQSFIFKSKFVNISTFWSNFQKNLLSFFISIIFFYYFSKILFFSKKSYKFQTIISYQSGFG